MLNEVRLIGFLGAAAETAVTREGRHMARLRVATNERWQDKSGEWQEETDWHTVVLWGDAAKRAERLDKGQRVFVDGRLKVRTWEDRQTGQKRHAVEVLARRVVSLDRTSERDDGGAAGPSRAGGPPASAGRRPALAPDPIEDFVDDIPF